MLIHLKNKILSSSIRFLNNPFESISLPKEATYMITEELESLHPCRLVVTNLFPV